MVRKSEKIWKWQNTQMCYTKYIKYLPGKKSLSETRIVRYEIVQVRPDCSVLTNQNKLVRVWTWQELYYVQY